MSAKYLNESGLSYFWSKIKAWCNSLFALDSAVVHKTGDETVSGLKTFTNSVFSNGYIGSIRNDPACELYFKDYTKGDSVSERMLSGMFVHDQTGAAFGSLSRLAVVACAVNTDKSTEVILGAYKNVANSTFVNSLRVICNEDGTGYALCSTPSSLSDSSDKIATTEWVQNNLKYYPYISEPVNSYGYKHWSFNNIADDTTIGFNNFKVTGRYHIRFSGNTYGTPLSSVTYSDGVLIVDTTNSAANVSSHYRIVQTFILNGYQNRPVIYRRLGATSSDESAVNGIVFNPWHCDSGGTLDVNTTGNAATATKLGTSTVGGSSQPIYLSDGSPVACDMGAYPYKGTETSSAVLPVSWPYTNIRTDSTEGFDKFTVIGRYHVNASADTFNNPTNATMDGVLIVDAATTAASISSSYRIKQTYLTLGSAGTYNHVYIRGAYYNSSETKWVFGAWKELSFTDHTHDTDYVKLTGDQTIAGNKTFSSRITLHGPMSGRGIDWVANTLTKGTAPSSDQSMHFYFLDKNGYSASQNNTFGIVGIAQYTNGTVAARLVGYSNSTSSNTYGAVVAGVDGDGVAYASATSTSSTRTNGIDIVTRDWIPRDTRIVHSTGNEDISGIKTFNSDIYMGTLGRYTVSGNIAKRVNTDSLNLCGGINASINSGSYIILEGISEAYSPGVVYIRTGKVNNSYGDLTMKPDGTFTWNGQNIQVSSDERIKTSLVSVPDEILDAWESVDWGQFQYLDAIASKGKSARLHLGLIAQHAMSAFESRGLDACKYGIFCHETDTLARDAEFSSEAESTDLWMVRYTEALCMEAAYQRRENARLKKRVADLEERLAALEAKLS